MKNSPIDNVQIHGLLTAQSLSAGASGSTSGIDTQGFEYLLVVVDVGDMGTGGTLTLNPQWSATDGSYATDKDQKYTLDQGASPTDENQLYIWEFRLDKDAVNAVDDSAVTRRWFRINYILATDASVVSATAYLFNADRQVDEVTAPDNVTQN